MYEIGLHTEPSVSMSVGGYTVRHANKSLTLGFFHAVIWEWSYAFASQLKIRRPRDLSRLRLQLARHVALASEHGTTAQRLYNVLCLAYGSDKGLFDDIVTKGFLPKERADICGEEYRQIDFAYHTLILPPYGSIAFSPHAGVVAARGSTSWRQAPANG